MNFRPLLIVPPIVIAVLGYLWMTQPDEARSQGREEVRLAVRAMQVQSAPIALNATGFGRVEPVHSWSSVSQVEGRVVEAFAELAI